MPVYTSIGISSSKIPDIDDIPNMSINKLVQQDNAFSNTPAQVSLLGVSDQVASSITPLYHRLDAGVIPSCTVHLYGQMYATNSGNVFYSDHTSRIDLGYISSSVDEPFGIWNSTASETTISAISISQPSAIVIEGFSVGDAINSMQELTGNLQVISTAPPKINCVINITFANGETIAFRITGLTAPPILVKPESGLTERIAFFTDIITARDGTEQRRALRRYPRHMLDVVRKTDDPTEISTIKNAMKSALNANIGLGYWHMSSYATAQPFAGDVSVSVDTEYATYTVGQYAIVYDTISGVYDVAKVSTVSASSIGFTDALEYDYTAALIAPYSFFINSTPISWTDGTAHTEFSFSGTLANPIVVDPLTFANEYKGFGVLPYNCLLFDSDSADSTISNIYDDSDGGTGLIYKSARWANSKSTVQFGIHAKTADECWELRQLIYALRGRQKSVWIPTMDRDFIPTVNLSGNDIVCEDNGYSSYIFGDDSIYNHIAVYRDGASPIYAEITGADTLDGVQTLTTDYSFPSINKDSVKISAFNLCRGYLDTSEIEWMNPKTECYCVLEFIAVKE